MVVIWSLLGVFDAHASGRGELEMRWLIRELGVDGAWTSEARRSARREACAAGVTLACGSATGPALVAAAEAAARPRCAAGDGAACVEVGWALATLPPGTYRPELPGAAEARALLAEPCAAGQARACTELGLLRVEGIGGPPDRTGVEVLRWACGSGEAHACAQLALQQGPGGLLPAEAASRRSNLQTACEASDPVGCAVLVREDADLELGEHVCATGSLPVCAVVARLRFDAGERSRARTTGLLERACDGEMCPDLGTMLWEIGRTADATSVWEEGCRRWGGDACQLLAAHADADAARRIWREACDRDDRRACRTLGVFAQDGRGGPKDPEEASRAFERSCELGLGDGCVRAGLHWRGKADETARARFDVACDGGHAWGCVRLGEMQRDGKGGPADLGAALVSFEWACEAGIGKGCNQAGIRHQQGQGTPVSLLTAAARYERGCGLNDGWSCFNLGKLRAGTRLGVPDGAAALVLYDRACAGGVPEACDRAGALSRAGKLVPADLARAVTAFRAACTGGWTAGCVHLGELVGFGDASVRDVPAAIDAYARACKKENWKACNSLGVLHERDGRPELAVPQFKEACAHDVAWGCHNAGKAERHGRGTATDTEAATRDFRKACDLGLAEACNQAGILADGIDARALYRRGCAKDEGWSCYNLAGSLGGIDGGDPRRVRALYERSCDAGVAEGCVRFAELAWAGRGGRRTRAEALAVLEAACARGGDAACRARERYGASDVASWARLQEARCAADVPSACAEIAALALANGRTPDVARLEAACDAGNGWSCALLGRHEEERGGDATAWYERACELGHPWSCDAPSSPILGRVTSPP